MNKQEFDSLLNKIKYLNFVKFWSFCWILTRQKAKIQALSLISISKRYRMHTLILKLDKPNLSYKLSNIPSILRKKT